MMKKILIIGTVIVVCLIAGYLLLWQQAPTQPAEELKLSDFPEVFKENTVIVIGENASQIEKESSGAIAANLENLTGNKPEIISSEKIESLKYTYNLIILGTPKSNEVLGEVYNMTNATRVTEEYPGENKGILEILRNPWNEDKAMLLVEGSDEWGVKAGSEMLADEKIAEKDILEINYANISKSTNLNISPSDFNVFSNAVRNYFDGEYPPISGTSYGINYDLKHAKWLEDEFPEARLIQAYAKFVIPPKTGTFIFWNGKTYVMPDEFNKFAIDANIQISNEEDALGVADVYVKAWEPSGSEGVPAAIILQKVDDIPHRVNPIPQNIVKQVTSPLVERQGNTFVLDLYTWCEIGGWVREWHISINTTGMITAENTLIGKYIGDCIVEGS